MHEHTHTLETRKYRYTSNLTDDIMYKLEGRLREHCVFQNVLQRTYIRTKVGYLIEGQSIEHLRYVRARHIDLYQDGSVTQ